MTLELKPLSKYQTQPMDEFLSKVMLSLNLDSDGTLSKKALSENKHHPLSLMIESHTKALLCPMTPQLKAFLFCVVVECGARPAIIDIFVTHMRVYAEQHGITEWNMQEFALFLPEGYPSEDTMSNAWDDLKAFRCARNS